MACQLSSSMARSQLVGISAAHCSLLEGSTGWQLSHNQCCPGLAASQAWSLPSLHLAVPCPLLSKLTGQRSSMWVWCVGPHHMTAAPGSGRLLAATGCWQHTPAQHGHHHNSSVLHAGVPARSRCNVLLLQCCGTCCTCIPASR